MKIEKEINEVLNYLLKLTNKMDARKSPFSKLYTGSYYPCGRIFEQVDNELEKIELSSNHKRFIIQQLINETNLFYHRENIRFLENAKNMKRNR